MMDSDLQHPTELIQKLLQYYKEGYDIVYHLLRLFVKRGNTNWYDLKIQYDLVMRYIRHKLSDF